MSNLYLILTGNPMGSDINDPLSAECFFLFLTL